MILLSVGLTCGSGIFGLSLSAQDRGHCDCGERIIDSISVPSIGPRYVFWKNEEMFSPARNAIENMKDDIVLIAIQFTTFAIPRSWFDGA